jgi:hypothetical protein
MQRRVDHAQARPRRLAGRRGRAGNRAGDRVQVRAGHLVAEPADEGAVRRRDRDPRQVTKSGDGVGYLLVHWWDDLRAIAQVELVAVVRGRVVACRDHDPGGGVQVPDGKGEQRGRLPRRQQPCPDPGPGKHPGGFLGELAGPVPGVAPDDHAGLRRVRAAAGGEPSGERRGGRPDHGAVHPVRAGPDRAAQARGAELQARAEPVGKVGRGRLAAVVEQRAQLGAVPLVRVTGDPALGLRAQFGADHGGGPGTMTGSSPASSDPIRPAAAWPAATTSA